VHCQLLHRAAASLAHAAVVCTCAATGSGSSGLSTFYVGRLQPPHPSAFGLSAPGNVPVVVPYIGVFAYVFSVWAGVYLFMGRHRNLLRKCFPFWIFCRLALLVAVHACSGLTRPIWIHAGGMGLCVVYRAAAGGAVGNCMVCMCTRLRVLHPCSVYGQLRHWCIGSSCSTSQRLLAGGSAVCVHHPGAVTGLRSEVTSAWPASAVQTCCWVMPVCR
jgi:hypothetical protein